jgi:hypothetical protein
MLKGHLGACKRRVTMTAPCVTVVGRSLSHADRTSSVHAPGSRPRPPELAAPPGLRPSPQLARCASGRAGWRLSRHVAVPDCCSALASSAPVPGPVLTRRPSVFQAAHIPSWRGSCERYALSPVAGGSRRLLLLLSPFLSSALRVRAWPPSPLGCGPWAPPLPPIGLTAADPFAGGEVSRADSRVR